MKLRKKYSREYRIWKAMRARCNSACYDGTTYRAKGIKCCKEWQSFAKFLEDMGPCPVGCSIDRIDNDGDYTASNCRWADNKTQAGNRGSFTPMYEYKGQSHILKDWARLLHVNYSTLRKRVLTMKMSLEEAINYVDPRDAPILWQGKYYTRQDLCAKYNIPLINFYDRCHKKWPLERILTTPVKHKI